MWRKIGLKSGPPLSIEPLSTKEEFEYFVNREKETEEVSSYLRGDHSFNLLITGKAGIGKTTLINKVLYDFPISHRINLSRLEEHQAIMDRITIEVAKFAKKLGIKEGEDIEKQLVYELRLIKATVRKVDGGIPFLKAGIGKEKGEEKTLRDTLISRETLLEELLEKIVNKEGLPIIFLDDGDHLPEKLQARILESCESIFASKSCISIFASRKETGKHFASDPDSVYRARFFDYVELKDIVKRDPQSVRQILLPRFKKVALKSFKYPFTQETDAFLANVCNSNIRELLRYADIVLRQAALQNVFPPITVEFAMSALASKNYLISQIDEETYTILNLLRKQMSASDKEFQESTGLGRTALSNKCNRLYESNLVNKIVEKNKILYRLSAKGEQVLRMYNMLRK